jgi:hypothetical protein
MWWTSMPGVATGGWVLLNVAHGLGGGIVAWDPVRKRLRAVMAIDERGYHVSIARRVLERARR